MRGQVVPSFYTNMGFKEQVRQLIEQALETNTSLFLVDMSINDSFKITITIDGDQGVALQDCIDLSRAVENNLDREAQDYSLEVASFGVGSPLKLVRQYYKNIGRTLIVKTNEEKIEAELTQATDDFITLSWESREQKKIGKGKETVLNTVEIKYSDIKEAIVTVTF
jgi:ribosome maturation factor RimP